MLLQYNGAFAELCQLIGEDAIYNKQAEIVKKTGLMADLVLNIMRVIYQKIGHYFFQDGFLAQHFLDLWAAVCDGELRMQSNSNKSSSTATLFNLDVDYRDLVHQRILDQISHPLAQTPWEIARWYGFASLCEIDAPICDAQYDQLIVRYCAHLAKNYHLILHQHNNLEADYYIGLTRSTKQSWTTRPDIIALIGIRQVNAFTWQISNLQGKVTAKHVFGQNEKSNMVSRSGSRMYNELQEFNWRHLLVAAAERLAVENSIKIMLFCSAEDNSHYNQYHNGSNAKFATNFFARYDGTARQTRYKKFIDSSGRKGWYKYLTEDQTQSVSLPPRRRYDGWDRIVYY